MQFDLLVKTRAYFIENWVDTPLQVPEIDFNNDNYEEYIRYEYVANGSDLVGLNCSEEHFGYVKIHCYNKNEILSLKLADSVKAFFGNTLGVDPLRVNQGTIYPTVKIDNNYYDTVVQFKIDKL